MLKKIATILTFSLVFFLSVVSSTEAHVLKVDNSIGAVLHIDPEDDPILNQPAYFVFEFRDKNNQFSLEQCNCTVHILDGRNEIFSQDLVIGGADVNTSSVSYTFSKKAVYNIEVRGEPQSGAKFAAFTLKYEVRVARENPAQTSESNANIYRYLALGGIAVIFIGLLFWDKIKTKVKRKGEL